MYSLTIAFGDTPAMWRLLFTTPQAGQAAYDQVINAADPNKIGIIASLTDDFGQSCFVVGVLAVMLEDLDQSKQAGVEMMLHNARTQALAQAQARQEPALRSAGQGPSVFVPNGTTRM